MKTNLIALISLYLFWNQSHATEFTCDSSTGPTPVQYGDIVNCSLDTDSEVDIFAFEVTEGDTFSVTVSQNSNCSGNGDGFNPFIRVRNSNGDNEGGSSNNCPNGVKFEVSANYSGIYTATVENNYQNEWGPYQIRFQCLGGPCIQQALMKKEMCEANFDGNLLDIPYLNIDSQSFWVKMNLINNNPIQLQLLDFGKH